MSRNFPLHSFVVALIAMFACWLLIPQPPTSIAQQGSAAQATTAGVDQEEDEKPKADEAEGGDDDKQDTDDASKIVVKGHFLAAERTPHCESAGGMDGGSASRVLRCAWGQRQSRRRTGQAAIEETRACDSRSAAVSHHSSPRRRQGAARTRTTEKIHANGRFRCRAC